MIITKTVSVNEHEYQLIIDTPRSKIMGCEYCATLKDKANRQEIQLFRNLSSIENGLEEWIVYVDKKWHKEKIESEKNKEILKKLEEWDGVINVNYY